MRLTALEPGTTVKIVAKRGLRTFSLDGKVRMQFNKAQCDLYEEQGLDLCILDMVTFKGQCMIFPEGKIYYELVTVIDGKKHTWSGVTIHKLRTADNQILHVAMYQGKDKKRNRRREYRLPMDVRCAVNVTGASRNRTHEAVLRDVSVSGIGFMINRSVDIKVGDTITVSWDDRAAKFNKGGAEVKNFKLMYRVVRVEILNEKMMTVGGVAVSGRNDEMAQYINKKQSERVHVG